MRVRLTLLYNLQQTATDLGDPKELEKIAQTATLLGDKEFPDGEGPDLSYKMLRHETFIARGVPCFDTAISSNQQNNETVGAICKAYKDRCDNSGMLRRTLTTLSKEAARRERTIQTAAGALSMNAADWLALEQAGAAARDNMGSRDEQHIVMSLHPLHLDLGRKARDALGLRADEIRVGVDAWPTDKMLEAFVMRSIVATGKFDTALVQD